MAAPTVYLSAATILLALSTGGCAQMIPARSTDLGNQRYELESSGNVFVKDGVLQGKLDQKAKKLCPQGYRYETDDAPRFGNTVFYYNGVLMPSGHFTLKRTIRCNTTEQTDSRPSENAQPFSDGL
ncbi:MAG: hypothetical protein Q4G28_01400 [Neisseria sp.]|nr:hypothetical protein [Neisseria sp.]